MSSNNNSSSSGIGFVGLLTIVFITLKLTNYIAWSWWWVLSPIWILTIILVIISIIAVKAINSKDPDMQKMIQDIRLEAMRRKRNG